MSNIPVLGQASPLFAPSSRLSERIKPWVEEALRKYSFGSPLRYDITFGLFPNQQGQAEPRLLIYIEADSAIIGKTVGNVTIADTHPNETAVDGMMKRGVEQVFQLRTKSASIGEAQR